MRLFQLYRAELDQIISVISGKTRSDAAEAATDLDIHFLHKIQNLSLKVNEEKCNKTKHPLNDKLGPLDQLDAPSDWYSGGGRFDLRSSHISFIEIRSWNIFYGHPLPTADSSRSVVKSMST